MIAPEAANNGVTSGTLVPTLALGVPGGSTAAVMMIVLQYHGMVMGPRLFATNPEIAYGVFVSMAVAYIFMIFTILPLARYMSRIVLIETDLSSRRSSSWSRSSRRSASGSTCSTWGSRWCSA